MIGVEFVVEPMLKLGFIGNGNHAKRLMSIVSAFNFCSIDVVYHPTVAPLVKGGSTNFDDLLSCDVVFIVSPNSTHTDYLLSLEKRFPGYVFCEKPPVNRLADLEKLSGLDPTRFFFGFNLRYSDLATWALEGIENGDIGQPIHADIVLTHGFAFKEQYMRSWKSSDAGNPSGIMENVAIHYVDLLATIFGRITKAHAVMSNFSGKGSTPDTAVIHTRHQSGATGNILVSYSTPFCDSFSLVGINGLLKYDGDVISVLSPRSTFGPTGMFATPPVIRNKAFSSDALYEDSLRNEMAFFLNCCLEKSDFELELLARSLESTRTVLRAYE